MVSCNDGLGAFVASAAYYLYIQLVAAVLLLFDADAVLGQILLAIFESLWCQVFQHLQQIFALSYQRTQGYSYRQTNHTCARYAYTHGILKYVGTQQSFYLIWSTTQFLSCFCRT